MTRMTLIALVLVLVTGCARVSGYIKTGVEAVKSANDTEAELVIKAPCLARLGAAGRVWSLREKALAAELCNYVVTPTLLETP